MLVVYLNERAQIVLQSLLMTSGDYMYDDSESIEQRNIILWAF